MSESVIVNMLRWALCFNDDVRSRWWSVVGRRFGDRQVSLGLAAGPYLAAASFALPLLSAGAGVAMPSAATGMRAAVESIDAVESVQYVLGGRRYCWSNRGWHGPGWR